MLGFLALAASMLAVTHADDIGMSLTVEWASGFQGRTSPLPAPTSNCQVCFYEHPQFKGEKKCIGKRKSACESSDGSSEALSIQAPPTIGSIRFTSSPDCELVTVIRVLDPPYRSHFDSFAKDVANTNYDWVVQELFIEEAGTACFLAAKDIDKYGKCYTKDVQQVEKAYQDAFYEVLLFESASKPFDVIAYSDKNFNRGKRDGALKKTFTTSSSDFVVNRATGDSLQYHINSIQFVHCNNASNSSI